MFGQACSSGTKKSNSGVAFLSVKENIFRFNFWCFDFVAYFFFLFRFLFFKTFKCSPFALLQKANYILINKVLSYLRRYTPIFRGNVIKKHAIIYKKEEKMLEEQRNDCKFFKQHFIYRPDMQMFSD
jgi:hypothetical protein